MGYAVLLIIHIFAATIALLSGFAALYVRKGSSAHRTAGTVFFASMLVMAASAVCLALTRSEMIDVVVGSFTFYLVATGWLTVKREARYAGPAQALLLLVGVAIGVGAFWLGWQAAHGSPVRSDGTVTVVYFAVASLAAFSVASDVSVFIRGGLCGTHRIARHIWRLCSALLFTSTAFFTPTRFSLPMAITSTHLNYLPILYVAAATIFWLVRVRLGNVYRVKTPRDTAASVSGAA